MIGKAKLVHFSPAVLRRGIAVRAPATASRVPSRSVNRSEFGVPQDKKRKRRINGGAAAGQAAVELRHLASVDLQTEAVLRCRRTPASRTKACGCWRRPKKKPGRRVWQAVSACGVCCLARGSSTTG